MKRRLWLTSGHQAVLSVFGLVVVQALSATAQDTVRPTQGAEDRPKRAAASTDAIKDRPSSTPERREPEGVVAVLGERDRLWDVVRALAYSPDGSILASASDDGIVHLHDPVTGAHRSDLAERVEAGPRGRRRVTGAFFDLDFSPGGETLIAAGGDRSIRRWKTAGWSSLGPLAGHREGVFAARFAAKGRIASASDDQTVNLWDTETGKPAHKISLPGGYYSALDTSPDGSLVAVGSWDRAIRIYDSVSGTLVQTLREHEARPLALAFTPDGSRLASADAAGVIRLWNASAWVALRVAGGHEGAVLRLAFAPDGSTLASSGADGSVRLWEVTDDGSLSPRRTYTGHQGPVPALAFRPNGTGLASGGVDATVRIWDTRSEADPEVERPRPGVIVSAAYSPDGSTIATGDLAGFIRVWYAGTGRIRLSLPGHRGQVGTVAFSPDGRVLATGGSDGLVRLWDAETALPIASLQGHTDQVTALAFHPDGSRLASAGHDQTLQLWDLAKHQCLWKKPGHAGAITSVAFSPDGQSLATAGRDRFTRIWDAAEGRKRAEIPPDMGAEPESVGFSQDSAYVLAAGFGDGTVKLYEAATGQIAKEYGRHRGQTRDVGVARGGTVIVSTGEDGSVRIWDRTLGKNVGVLQLHAPRGTISRLAVSPRGDQVLTVNGDGTVFVVDLALSKPDLQQPDAEQ
ncbi:WD40 repeat domain-containing protein [Singulisphaera sp. Ch08]|uniref:WD40 repeat domain-containing protein n=1 Tax=Singulisphaera sp. Ch08 TaxID=3120278 RepID=A0AAU7C771_9BACT